MQNQIRLPTRQEWIAPNFIIPKAAVKGGISQDARKEQANE